MQRNDCIHIYRGDSETSSRIKLQLAWRPGTVIDHAQHSLFLALMNAFSSRPSAIVFHGQSTLPYLLFSVFIRLLSRGSFKVVYDMHDLNERPLTPSFRSMLRYRVFYGCEYIVSRLRVNVITVSKGLARIFFKRFRRSARVVYNVSFEVDGDKDLSGMLSVANVRTGVVYFGLLEPGRISIEQAREVLMKTGEPVFDIYGRVPKGDNAVYSAQLNQLSATTGLRIIGPYDPTAMGFLGRYRYSWLCFDSDRLNIRYCMPNKLFQSLSAGLCCVISDRLVEARTMFGDACLSYRECLDVCEGKIKSPAEGINWSDVEARMEDVAARSRTAFLEAI